MGRIARVKAEHLQKVCKVPRVSCRLLNFGQGGSTVDAARKDLSPDKGMSI
jgi:hypothetical protein